MRRTRFFFADWRRISILVFMAMLPSVVYADEKDPEITSEHRLLALQIFQQTLEDYRKSLTLELLDPRLLAARIGGDAANLGRWVAENTVLTPYRGSLKGAEGVLVDREGNSLDRSLLLSRMLKAQGYKTRLARMTLPEEAADRLLSAGTTSRFLDIPEPLIFDPVLLRTRLLDAKLPPGFVYELVPQSQKEPENVGDRLLERFSEIAPGIEQNAVENARRNRDDRAAMEHRQQAEAISEHWWVQYRDGAQWRDLDPDFEVVGVDLVAQETLEPEKIPSSLLHRVQIGFVVELFDGKTLKEHKLLSVDVNTPEYQGSILRLVVAPLDDEITHSLSNGKIPTRPQLLAAKRWQPVLISHTSVNRGEGFSLDGEIISSQEAAMTASPIGGALSGATGFLRQLQTEMCTGAGCGNKPGAKTKPTTTAAWIEVMMQRPGAAAETRRRALYDVLDRLATGSTDRLRAARDFDSESYVAQSRSESLLAEHRIAVSSARICGLAATKNDLDVARSISDMLIKLFRGEQIDEQSSLKRTGYSAWLLQFDQIRWQINPVSENVYMDRPNVYMQHSLPKLDSDVSDSPARQQFIFDIVINGVGARNPSLSDPYAARVRQGVADTVAETAFFDFDSRLLNAAYLLEGAKYDASAWLSLTREKVEDYFAGKTVPPGVKHMVRARLVDSDSLILVPRELETQVGLNSWWSVDPETGETLGEGLWGGQTRTIESIRNLGALTALGIGFCMWAYNAEDIRGWQRGTYKSCIVDSVVKHGSCLAIGVVAWFFGAGAIFVGSTALIVGIHYGVAGGIIGILLTYFRAAIKEDFCV